jgi:NADPH-dependent glutamate synthase beta subunit-like oxidoreductase
MKHVAIVGSGPAGCYLADSLLRLIPDASVDVLERLPVPFGLIRYGVAPDHQSTKAVARLFDRTLSRDSVSFFGNVEVGRDVRLDELQLMYDAVVLATGAPRDRRLNIPGEDLPGVMGSGAFVGWYNGHPEDEPPKATGVRSAVIIGNGNVALDVARILAKSSAELTGSDLPPRVMEWLQAQLIDAIHVVGRRGPAYAKFNDHELAELGTLQCAQPVLSNPADLFGTGPVMDTLRDFAALPLRAPVSIDFHFNLTPVAFVGEQQLRAVQFRSPDGTISEVPAQLAVTCIGYESRPCCIANPTNGLFANEQGKISDGLYVVGWAKRGPNGTIPTNRTEAHQVAQKIAAEVTESDRRDSVSLRDLLRQRNVEWVDYAGWKRIEAAEISGACDDRCRQKLCTVQEMLSAARQGQLNPV